MKPYLLRRLTLCALHLCPARAANDDDGLWGECVICGRRSGYVSRAEMRAYLDKMEATERREGGEA